jgi:hypothetical protein
MTSWKSSDRRKNTEYERFRSAAVIPNRSIESLAKVLALAVQYPWLEEAYLRAAAVSRQNIAHPQNE